MADRSNNHPCIRAWDVHNVLATLHEALPLDTHDCVIPTKCLVRLVLDMSAKLALDLDQMNFSAKEEARHV